ncbi:MAG: hypothetical protein LBT90_02255 [Holosporaceae bacterium]|jgi:multidrug transporter EmrE-like cation transporter|nr:hypothetical protein [Holosporaceae bacterium]
MNYLHIFLIFIQIILVSSSQLLLKSGVSRLNFDQPLLALLLSVITNWHILGGTIGFAVALSMWLYLLSQFDISFLYPFNTALTFMAVAVGGWIFFAENVSVSRIVGIILIMIGVVCIAKS